MKDDKFLNLVLEKLNYKIWSLENVILINLVSLLKILNDKFNVTLDFIDIIFNN